MRYIFGGNITVQSSDSLIWVFFLVNDIFTNLIYQKKTNIFHKALGEDLNEKEVSTYSIELRFVPIFFKKSKIELYSLTIYHLLYKKCVSFQENTQRCNNVKDRLVVSIC